MKQMRTLAIDGMTCGDCIRHVSEALKSVDGVDIKEVGIGTARVAYDPAATPDDQLLAAVREAGYQAKVQE